MSGDVLTLGNIGNPQHRSILRHISDVFDNHRGKIDGYVALTRFKGNSHTILFNSLSPDLNGKQLISVENNDSILYAPIEIDSIICSDKRNNATINTLIAPNNREVWEAVSDEGRIKLLLRLPEGEQDSSSSSPPTPAPTIAGFSIKFADGTKTKYRIGVTMVTSQNEIVSQAAGMDSSFESNNTQFFAFANAVEGATRIVVDIEVVGTNIYEWKLANITLYSHMNKGSLKALADVGAITYNEYPNSILVREAKDEILKGVDMVHKGPPAESVPIPPAKEGDVTVSNLNEKTFDYTDAYGTPLILAPKLTHQFFDRLGEKEIKKISSIKRLYSTTDLRNGHKIYTFETDPNTKKINLTFSPSDEMAKFPDEAVSEMDKLRKRGYIKKGGYKNYCLTFYVKLDEITMQDQFLVWKYGGWLFNDQLPELSRSTDIYIPITGADHRPRAFTEYVLNNFREIKEGIVINDVPTPVIPEGKWIGFQFIRQVQEDGTCIIDIDINRDPVNENGEFTNTIGFEPYFQLIDESKEGNEQQGDSGHIANNWGGINEIISIAGSKYISFYGISLYELDI